MISHPPLQSWSQLVNLAWSLSPEVATSLLNRFQVPQIREAVTKLVLQHPTAVFRHPQALMILLEERRFDKRSPANKVQTYFSA